MTCAVTIDLACHERAIDRAEGRDRAIEARVAELMADEPGPEFLAEMFASGYANMLVRAMCRRLHKAAFDENQDSKMANCVSIGDEMLSLYVGYSRDLAVERARREIR